METDSFKMIIYFFAFLAGIVTIAWGFYAVDKTAMAKNEKLLWKVLFFIAPIFTLLVFLLVRKKIDSYS